MLETVVEELRGDKRDLQQEKETLQQDNKDTKRQMERTVTRLGIVESELEMAKSLDKQDSSQSQVLILKTQLDKELEENIKLKDAYSTMKVGLHFRYFQL